LYEINDRGNSESMRQKNWLLWTGALALVLAIALGIVPVIAQLPGQQVLPGFDLLFSVVAVALFILGLRRATREPQRYRGKVAGWILTALSSLLLLFTIFGFYAARHIPQANAAPQVGQKAPDFQLKDVNGKTTSLAQLLSEPLAQSASGSRPKAVLLVFYRGYW
jgi:hypothetical protein